MAQIATLVTAAVVLISSRAQAESFYYPGQFATHSGSSFLSGGEPVVPFYNAFPLVHATSVDEASYQPQLNLQQQSRFLNPLVNFAPGTGVRGTAPLCLTCSCLVGRKTCQQAGGVQVITTDINTGTGANGRVQCTPAAPCVLDPPAQLSACDPTCKLRNANCNPANTLQQPNTCQTALAAADTQQCGTPCENLQVGAEVVCTPAFQNTNVISRRPPVCGARNARSLDRDSRQLRLLFLNPLQGLNNLNNIIPAGVGPAVFRYLPRDTCIPRQVAAAPFCQTV